MSSKYYGMGMVCPGLMAIYGTLERQRYCTNNGFGMETIRMDGARSLINSFTHSYICMCVCTVWYACMYVLYMEGNLGGGARARVDGRGGEGNGREVLITGNGKSLVLTYYIVLYRTIS